MNILLSSVLPIFFLLGWTGCSGSETQQSDLVGTYETNRDGMQIKYVLKEDGFVENYLNGSRKGTKVVTWVYSEGVVRLINQQGMVILFRVNEDGSLTCTGKEIVGADGAKWSKEFQVSEQIQFKKTSN
tara:strand:+ start:712 stop:1098 length:387 start_codon:yes stop_codon:yes gene_type:complete